MNTENELYNSGIDALENGHVDVAVKLLNDALSADKTDTDVLYALAYCYDQNGDYRSAVRLARRCIRLKPDHIAARAFLAGMYKEMGDERRASKAFREYFREASVSCCLAQYATLKRHSGRHREAVDLYAAVIALGGANGSVYNNMAMSLNRLGRHKEAISACRSGLRIDSNDLQLQLNLAVSLRESGRTREALSIVSALPLSADNEFHIALERGNLYADLGLKTEAAATFAEAKSLRPTSNSPYINLGILYDSLGQYPDGEAEFRAAIRIDPDDPDPHQNLGACLELQGRLDEAEAEFKLAKRRRKQRN